MVGVYHRERIGDAELELQSERMGACHRRDGPAALLINAVAELCPAMRVARLSLTEAFHTI